MQKTLFAVASGSGGHILPALIAAGKWHKQNPGSTVIFCTGTSSLDKKILSSYPFINLVINFKLDKFIPKKVWLYPKVFLQVFLLFMKSLSLVIKHKPKTIISTGGLIAIPLCFAGRILGSRIEIYELNVVPGKAVKALMPLAHVIYTPFLATKKYCRLLGVDFGHRCRMCDYPIRFDAGARELHGETSCSIALANFEKTRKTIFLLGGSQGSLMLNNALKNFLLGASKNILQTIQIIHQTGESTRSPREVQEAAACSNYWPNFYQKLGIPAITFSYHENVKDFYNQADLIICRAGAGTIFEVAFFEKPCIVIPLVASSTSHQIENACEIAKQYPHLFTVIEQSTVVSQPTVLYKTILQKLG